MPLAEMSRPITAVLRILEGSMSNARILLHGLDPASTLAMQSMQARFVSRCPWAMSAPAASPSCAKDLFQMLFVFIATEKGGGLQVSDFHPRGAIGIPVKDCGELGEAVRGAEAILNATFNSNIFSPILEPLIKEIGNQRSRSMKDMPFPWLLEQIDKLFQTAGLAPRPNVTP